MLAHFTKEMLGKMTAYSFSSSSLFHATTNFIIEAVGLYFTFVAQLLVL